MKPYSVSAILSPLLLSFLTWSGSAAGVISVNYTPLGSEMFPDEVAGAPGSRVANWNNAFTGGGSSFYDLFNGEVVDQNGTVINGLSISFFTGNAGSTTQRGNPPGGTAPALENDGRMFRTVTDKFQPDEGTITLTGIPYAEYSLVFYVYPDAGGGGERGGYFSVTNAASVAQTRWLKGGTGPNSTIPLPDPATGGGYLESTTAVQPASFADIQPGHYVVLPGLTDPNVVVYYSAAGSGSGAAAVTGGDGTRRLKFSGFQIVEAATGTVASLSLETAVPDLYAGNPQGYGVPVVAVYSDGSSVPLNSLAQAAYQSSNTNVFTVSAKGVVQPGAPGMAELTATFGTLTLTRQIKVLPPDAVRPSVSADPIYAGASGIPITVVADFADGALDVDVTHFSGVTFGGSPASVVTVSPDGLLTAVAAGDFTLSATYAGVTGETAPAGTVLAYDPPQLDGGVTALSFNIRSGNAMAVNDLAGAPGVRTAFWNNISGLTGSRNTVTLDSGTVRDSAGQIVSGLSASVTGGNSGGGASTRGAQNGNESTMFNGVYDQYNGVPGTIAVSGIPFASYDAYFYALSGDADYRVGHFTIGEQTRWILDSTFIFNPDNDGFGYEEAITTVQPTMSFEAAAGNYVKFTGLTGSTLNVEFAADGSESIADSSGAPRLKFAGFQLVGVQAPRIAVSRTDATHAELSWPASAAGYELKSSSTVNGSWNPAGPAPQTIGGKLVVTVSTDADAAFYRLEKP